METKFAVVIMPAGDSDLTEAEKMFMTHDYDTAFDEFAKLVYLGHDKEIERPKKEVPLTIRIAGDLIELWIVKHETKLLTIKSEDDED